MKITDDLVKQYIEFNNKRNKIKQEVEQFQSDKYIELLAQYDINDIRNFYNIKDRVNNYSEKHIFFFISAMFLVPLIISLTCMRGGYSTLNINFMILSGMIGLSLLGFWLFITIKDFRLVKKYNEFKNEQ